MSGNPTCQTCAEVNFDERILTPLQFFASRLFEVQCASALLTTARRGVIDAGTSQSQIGTMWLQHEQKVPGGKDQRVRHA